MRPSFRFFWVLALAKIVRGIFPGWARRLQADYDLLTISKADFALLGEVTENALSAGLTPSPEQLTLAVAARKRHEPIDWLADDN